ncbi:MAG TPA: hypothetical protein VMZ66_08770 [Aeromicrobium sp.]|nr:hypothetical protein [Aeromicrobium sp.]
MDKHRAIGRRTPAEAFAAREKAFPTGNLTLRYRGRTHHIGVGTAYKDYQPRP